MNARSQKGAVVPHWSVLGRRRAGPRLVLGEGPRARPAGIGLAGAAYAVRGGARSVCVEEKLIGNRGGWHEAGPGRAWLGLGFRISSPRPVGRRGKWGD